MTESVPITTNWGEVHPGCYSILLVSTVACQIGVNAIDDVTGLPSGTVFAELSANEMRRFDFEDEPFKVFVKGSSTGTLDYQVLWEGGRRQYPATSSIVSRSDFLKDLENNDIPYEGTSPNTNIDYVLGKLVISGKSINNRLVDVESWETTASTQLSTLDTDKISKVADTSDEELAVFTVNGDLRKSSKSLIDFVSSSDLDTLTGPDFAVGMTIGENAVAITNLNTSKASVSQLDAVKGEEWSEGLTLVSLSSSLTNLDANKANKVSSPIVDRLVVLTSEGDIAQSSYTVQELIQQERDNVVSQLDEVKGEEWSEGLTLVGLGSSITNLDANKADVSQLDGVKGDGWTDLLTLVSLNDSVNSLDTNKASVDQLDEVKGDGWTGAITLASLSGSISSLSSNKANKVFSPTVGRIVVLTSEGDIAQSSYTIQELVQQGQTNAIQTQYKETPEGSIVLSAELSHFSAGRIKIPVGSSVTVPVGTEWWVV